MKGGTYKTIVVNDLKAKTFKKIVKQYIEVKSIIDTDNLNSYAKFKDLDIEHRPKIIPKHKVNEMLPWVHIVIGNTILLLLDIHHDVEP